jgi:GT2 family glycosyltransferase
VGNLNKFVCIIIVNWNGLFDTKECLQSLGMLNYKNYKIIVVDNGSTESIQVLKQDFKNVIYLDINDNLGFSGANNLGIQKALEMGADAVWLLNNDTTVSPDSLNIMLSRLYSNEVIGVVCPKIYYYDEPDMLWFAGGEIIWHKGITVHNGQFKKSEEIGNDQDRQVNFATGCSLLIKVDVIKKVGFLSEEYFLYYEDTDYCCKVLKAGFQIYYCSKSIIWHKVSRSTTKSSIKDYYITRNNLYFMFKNSPKKYILIFLLYFIKRNIRYIYLYLNSKKDTNEHQKARAIIRAIKDFLSKKIGKANFIH